MLAKRIEVTAQNVVITLTMEQARALQTDLLRAMRQAMEDTQ